MKEPTPCLPVKATNNQNHGQIRVCSQGKLKGKKPILGQLQRTGSGRDSETFPLELVVQCLLGGILQCRKGTIPRELWVSVCVLMQNFIPFSKVCSLLFF